MYINFRFNVVYVKGFIRSAVYNLNLRALFWLSVEETTTIEKLLNENIDLTKLEVNENKLIKELIQQGLITLDCSKINLNNHLETKQSRNIEKAWVELDTGCNHKCTHCYNSSSSSQVDNQLNIHELKKYIREAKNLGIKSLTFIGGEPLLHKVHLKELISFSKLLNFDEIAVCTNGTLIDSEWATFFSEHKISVSVSIYGDTESLHETITRSKGSFNLTKKGIQNLLDRNCLTILNVIVMPANEENLPDVVSSLQKLFLKAKVSFDYLRPAGRGLLLYKQLQLKYLNRYRELDKESCFVGPNENEFRSNLNYNPCLKDKIMITGKGVVSNCIMSRDECGSLKKLTMREIINSPSFKEIQELSLSKVEGCSDCEFKYACNDCRPIAKNVTGNLYAKPPECNYNPYTGIYSTF